MIVVEFQLIASILDGLIVMVHQAQLKAFQHCGVQLRTVLIIGHAVRVLGEHHCAGGGINNLDIGGDHGGLVVAVAQIFHSDILFSRCMVIAEL